MAATPRPPWERWAWQSAPREPCMLQVGPRSAPLLPRLPSPARAGPQGHTLGWGGSILSCFWLPLLRPLQAGTALLLTPQSGKAASARSSGAPTLPRSLSSGGTQTGRQLRRRGRAHPPPPAPRCPVPQSAWHWVGMHRSRACRPHCALPLQLRQRPLAAARHSRHAAGAGRPAGGALGMLARQPGAPAAAAGGSSALPLRYPALAFYPACLAGSHCPTWVKPRRPSPDPLWSLTTAIACSCMLWVATTA